MENEPLLANAERPDRAQEQTNLAVLRTLMAADRSLMAWVRTGLSLITFGFTVFKFLQFERGQLLTAGATVVRGSSPRTIGLVMIGAGLLCLALGTIENMVTMKGIPGRDKVRHPRYSLWMSVLMMVLGLVVFLGVLLKINGLG